MYLIQTNATSPALETHTPGHAMWRARGFGNTSLKHATVRTEHSRETLLFDYVYSEKQTQTVHKLVDSIIDLRDLETFLISMKKSKDFSVIRLGFDYYASLIADEDATALRKKNSLSHTSVPEYIESMCTNINILIDINIAVIKSAIKMS